MPRSLAKTRVGISVHGFLLCEAIVGATHRGSIYVNSIAPLLADRADKLDDEADNDGDSNGDADYEDGPKR